MEMAQLEELLTPAKRLHRAIDQLGLESKFSHVSMGGGASITYLSGEPLPGIEALKKASLRMRKS